jgi:hypothetical protein
MNLKLFIILLFSILLSHKSQAQGVFNHDSPFFTLDYGQNWKLGPQKSTSLLFGTIYKIKNDTISSILRIGKDLYLDKLGSVWNINENGEKYLLEMSGAVIDSLKIFRTFHSDRKTSIITFKTILTKGAKKQKYFGKIYKFLLVENSQEHILFFFLIAPDNKYDADVIDFDYLMKSLKFNN